MHILQVYKDYHPVVGGIENHIKMLSEALVEVGQVVTVLTTNTTGRTQIEEIGGVRVIKAARLTTISSAPISLSLVAWMRRLRPDITHLHFPYPIGELAFLLVGQSPTLIVTYHSDIVRQRYLLQIYKPFLRRILSRADRITVSSPNYIQSSEYLRPLADKCTVIPHGTDLERFAPSPETEHLARKLRADHPGPIVLFVGLLRYYKGVSYLIEAMQSVGGHLLVVGQGPMGQQWKALAQRLGLGDRVTFLGRVRHEELVALYHACDVFVLPAVHRSESWGAVQVEAMAAGKPVICTELGTGTSFVNVHGETGLVVPPSDSVALASALNRLICDSELRETMGRQARERAQAEFSLSSMVRRILQLYRQPKVT